MELICKITGKQFDLPSFLPDCKTPLSMLHPVLTLAPQDLDKLVGRHLNTSMDEDSIKLIFVAYLYHSKLVQFKGRIDLANLSKDFCIRWMRTAMQISKQDTFKNIKELEIPKFTLSLESMSFIDSWLVIMKGIVIRGYNPLERDLRFSNKHEMDMLADDFNERERYRNAMTAAKKLKQDNAKAHLTWGKAELKAALPDIQFQDCLRIFDNYQRYPVNAIEAVRRLCLTYLPENNDNVAVKKWEVLSFLDSIIVNKTSVEMLLSDSMEERKLHRERLENIQSNYSIIKDGELYTNSAIPFIQQIETALEFAPKVNGKPLQVVDTPKSEPKQANYKSKIAYLVACRKWEEEKLKIRQQLKTL